MKNRSRFTDDQELYLQKVLERIEAGGLPKQTVKDVLESVQALKSDMANPLKVLACVQKEVSPKLLDSHYSEGSSSNNGKREVILSLFLGAK